jgi:peptidoglycan/xylan/chitin deacetylase (PgdA/CDA1 family)
VRVRDRVASRIKPRTDAAVVLMYHRVDRNVRDPFWLRVQPEHFAEHLQRVTQIADVVPLTSIFEKGSRPRVALTFDDGYADNFFHAKPLLEDAGLPATIFVTSEILGSQGMFWWDRLEHLVLDVAATVQRLRINLGGSDVELDVRTLEGRARAFQAIQGDACTRPPVEIQALLDDIEAQVGKSSANVNPAPRLTLEQLRAIGSSSLLDIGGHTRHHPMLSSLDRAQQYDEIVQGKADLEKALGRPVTTFAYPFGSPSSFTVETVELVHDAGFELACTTEQGRVTPRTDRYRVPRVSVNDLGGRQFRHRLQWALNRANP